MLRDYPGSNSGYWNLGDDQILLNLSGLGNTRKDISRALTKFKITKTTGFDWPPMNQGVHLGLGIKPLTHFPLSSGWHSFSPTQHNYITFALIAEFTLTWSKLANFLSHSFFLLLQSHSWLLCLLEGQFLYNMIYFF